jgi:hypothetical protein
MATAGEVKVRITGDMRDLQVALNRAGQATERAAGNMERRWQALGATFARVGAIMGTAIAAGVALSVREAAGAEEIRDKFNVVFRGIEDDVRDWAETTAEATARSSIALEQYLSTFQDTFVPLGLARAEAAEFSQTLTQLAIDLASFNNESEPETVRALQSALVGNHETVRRYGVVINQAFLEQELLNMGIRGGVEAATAAQMAMARLNLIMEGTTDAHGNAADTAESATNQWRSFTAELRDAALAIGESFMPAALQLLEWLENALPRMQQAGVWLGNLSSGIAAALGGGTVFEPITEDDIREQRERVEDLLYIYQNRLSDQAAGRGGGGVNWLTLAGVLPQDQLEAIREEADNATELFEGVTQALQARADALSVALSNRLRLEGGGESGGGGGGGGSTPTPFAPQDLVYDMPEEWVRQNERVIQSVEDIKAAYEAMEPVGISAFTETMEAAREMEEALERVQSGALKSLEDAFVDFVRTGRFEIANFVDYIIEQFARLAFQQYLEGPINSVLSSVINGIGNAIGIPGVGSGVKAASGQVRTSQAPVTNVYNIDARYATEGTAEMISRAFQQNTPRIVRQSVDASVSSISQIQSSQRAV